MSETLSFDHQQTFASDAELPRLGKSARKIIKTAEQLFAERGIDNVSLREIATASGQSNNSAVQYHFGSKEGLVQTIFEIKIPFLENARKRRLETLSQTGNENLESLLTVLLFPILEIFDSNEQRVFAGFSLHLLHRDPSNHPFYRAKSKLPVSTEIYHRIQQQLNHLPQEVFATRIRLIASFFLSSVLEKDHYNSAQNSLYNDNIYWSDMIAVFSAMLREPFNETPRFQI